MVAGQDAAQGPDSHPHPTWRKPPLGPDQHREPGFAPALMEGDGGGEGAHDLWADDDDGGGEEEDDGDDGDDGGDPAPRPG